VTLANGIAASSGGAGASGATGNVASGGERPHADGLCARESAGVGSDPDWSALLATLTFGATCLRAARRSTK
jgi:hypothetical protein